ncbi:MAG: M20/M25/M40 family metallo-hydrolase [Solirubrobacteraceae bacterium]|nr:M20/M25/M40 family metallo-hydrolase [Solirubrobacteraceae bacterium]
MSVPVSLRSLLESIGPSGRELAPAQAFAEVARTYSDDVNIDLVGSVSARVPGTADGAPRIAFVGHVDEIGLIVTHIDEKGFIWFGPVGGWDPVILVGQRVELQTKNGPVKGVVGKKAVHLLEADERGKPVKINQLHIDIGAGDGDEAKATVEIGDVAVIDAAPVDLLGERVTARAMDNRLGAYVALDAARRVAEAGGAAGDVYAVGAAQEEITFAGARTSAFRIDPQIAIVIDVTHATDAPGVDEKELGSHPLGSGAVIARGATIHPAISRLLIETAEAEGIDYTVEVSGRGTSTDADAIHISRQGVACGVVSIPLRYMHSPVETIDLRDVEAAVALVAAFAKRVPADLDLGRGAL